MAQLAEVVKSLFVPGSMAFLVVGVAFGVSLLYSERLDRWGRRWLTALVLLYLALATPVVSDRLQHQRNPPARPLTHAADARGASTVVVLGNGALTYTDGDSQLPALTRRTSFNIMEGVRLYRLLGHPRLILSGGIVDPESQTESEAALMAEAMIRLGVPRQALGLEDRSSNTYEQSARVAAMLPAGSTIVLVTTPIHMTRAKELFEARGMKVVPSPSRIGYSPAVSTGAVRFVPNASSLRASELSIYEYLALANGWARGWLARSDTLQ